MPAITVIVPTFNEGGNVPELVRRLSDSFTDQAAEILFVDDSTDDTPEIIRLQTENSPIPIRLLHREGPARVGGLAGAVTDGIRDSDSECVVVMDGDLQHPPEMARLLVDTLHGTDAPHGTDTLNGRTDLVVASRYLDEGDAGGLSSQFRRGISNGSTLITQALFPRRVGAVCTDPMTGFFCFRRSAVDLGRLRPRGFKILLEILASHSLQVREIPFVFGERTSGESKASWRNGLSFLLQLLSLRLGSLGLGGLGLGSGRMSRGLRFAAVGAFGFVINLALMAIMLRFGVHYVAASIVATELTIASNFVMQERLVFHDLLDGRHAWRARALQSLAYNNADALVRLPFLVLLVEHTALGSLSAQGLTLVASFGARFVFNHKVVYGRPVERLPLVVAPPSDEEKYAYLQRPQHRWLFWAQAVAFVGVAVSLYGLARNTYWTIAFLLPLLAFVIEQVLALRTSTFRRRVTLPDHLFLVETYQPETWPSVDVFLPTAGEPLDLLLNTYTHVARIDWPGELDILVLDDAGRPEVQELAERFGFSYLARPGSEFKKAGNLQYAFERSVGDHITILDADFVPRPDYLRELIPYLDDGAVGDDAIGIVQSPQYFSTDKSLSWLERCAGATQEMFYRFIQPSRDAVGAAICVGTSAIYRREALTAIGGFPQIGHSEDVYTGVEMARFGYGVQYVPVLVSRGKSPDDLGSFVSQQYRWCQGSMALAIDPAFHLEPTMTGPQRSSFWSGFLYYTTTAMNAILAPLAVLVMVWFFPDKVASTNMIPLVGATLLWLVIFPLVSHGRWRIEVLRVQTIYGFAHLFCLLDMARGHSSEWVATNAAAPAGRSLAARVRLTMAVYIAVTQVAVTAGLILGTWRFGIEHYWANIALAALSAYVFLPVAWLSIQAIRADAATSATSGTSGLGTVDETVDPVAVSTPAPVLIDLADGVPSTDGTLKIEL